MIAAGKGAGALDRPEIGDILDDAEQGRVAPRIAADRARVRAVEIAANAAGMDSRAGFGERGGERLQQALAALQQEERGTPRRARTEPGQLGEMLDETIDLGHLGSSKP